MNILLERINFKITNIILSQKQSFTLEDVVNEVVDQYVDIDKEIILSTINNLRDTGLINDYGSKYSLSSLMMR
jgi:predicted transcriptional regulator